MQNKFLDFINNKVFKIVTSVTLGLAFVGSIAFSIFGFGDFVLPVEVFKNSLWGVLIAYTPMQIIVIVIMASNKDGFFNGMV